MRIDFDAILLQDDSQLAACRQALVWQDAQLGRERVCASLCVCGLGGRRRRRNAGDVRGRVPRTRHVLPRLRLRRQHVPGPIYMTVYVEARRGMLLVAAWIMQTNR